MYATETIKSEPKDPGEISSVETSVQNIEKEIKNMEGLIAKARKTIFADIKKNA